MIVKSVSHCPNVDSQWTIEYVPWAAPSGILLHAKDFAISPKIDPNAGEAQSGLYDGLQCAHKCPDVFMIISELLVECAACLIVCPSGINFRTV